MYLMYGGNMRYQVNPSDFDLKTRKRKVFKDFRGVDTLSPVYSIDERRASKMCNFISRDGENHKRYGWKKYLQFNTGAINGVFNISINKTKFNIVYAGTTFWIKKSTESGYKRAETCDYITDTRDLTLLTDMECKCYIQNDKAYFIGMGDLLVFDYDRETEMYRFARVLNDKNTYIPTTTENISCEEQDLDTNSNPIKYSSRYSGEDINVLNNRRKNTIIGSQVGGGGSPVSPRTYQLDLLPEEVIDQSSIEVEGYDYNASNGLKSNIYLKSRSSQGTIYSSINASNIPLSTMNGKVYLRYCPIPEGFGEENAVKLLEGEYTSNNQTLYKYEISYYQSVSSYVVTFPIFKWEITRYRQAGTLVIKVTSGSITKTFTQQGAYKDRTSSDTPERLSPYQYGYAIDIAKCFQDAEIDITSHLSDIVTSSSSYGEQDEDETMHYYFSYINSAIYLYNGFDASDNKVYGYLSADTGKLQLATDTQEFYARSIAGEPNLTISFSVLGNESYKKITESMLSVPFGIGGNALALFVSGYTNEQNKDWWSKELDYTYFPSGNECSLGTENTAVVGYQVLGDSSLAIFKQYSTQEPSVYIRGGTDTQMSQSDDGTLSIVTGGYYTTGKYMSKGVLAPKSIAVLQSDPLVLTQDGVCALTIDASTSSISNRVFRERSRLIDNIINKHSDRESARAFVYDGKYFLCIGSDVYIADSRYTFNVKGDMTDTFNYEWWIWDHCPMNYIFENEEGDLCFGTKDGEMCKFYNGFVDVTNTEHDISDFSMRYYSYGDNVHYIYSPIMITSINGSDMDLLYHYNKEGEEFYIKSNEPIYVRLKLNQNTAPFYDGTIVHKRIGSAVTDEEYTIVSTLDDDTMEYSFSIMAEDGTIESATPYVLVEDIRGIPFKVHKMDAPQQNNPDFYFYVPVDSALYDASIEDADLDKWIDITWGYWYDYTKTMDRTIQVIHKENENNVVAYWHTPALDFGTNDYEKTMLSVTIATERYTNGQLDFGWETKADSSELTSKGMDVFDFNDINFNRIALDTGWNTSYTRNLKRNFNFIMFRFISDNNVDCCVHQFTIGYKINRKNKGVK